MANAEAHDGDQADGLDAEFERTSGVQTFFYCDEDALVLDIRQTINFALSLLYVAGSVTYQLLRADMAVRQGRARYPLIAEENSEPVYPKEELGRLLTVEGWVHHPSKQGYDHFDHTEAGDKVLYPLITIEPRARGIFFRAHFSLYFHRSRSGWEYRQFVIRTGNSERGQLAFHRFRACPYLREEEYRRVVARVEPPNLGLNPTETAVDRPDE